MTRILRVDASSRRRGSHSRDLADRFIAEWRAREPDAAVTVRDLIATPVPHIADATIEGYYTPADRMSQPLQAATALSDILISEVRDADVLVISTPMYNFSIPSALKAWIDQIVRIGHTFSYDGRSFAGLLPGKRAYVMIACGAGGYVDQGPLAAADFARPYLRFLLGFLGVSDVHFITIEQTTADAAIVAAERSKATSLVETAVRQAFRLRTAA